MLCNVGKSNRSRRLDGSLTWGEEPFEDLQGNHLGYARSRSIGISPMNPLKHKTRFHEMAHVVLGHTTVSDMHDDETLTRQIEEAEGVAYLLCALLDACRSVGSRMPHRRNTL